MATKPSILIIGASRGLGHAMAVEFVNKGWHVTGTVRSGARTLLHDLADQHKSQVDIQLLDIRDQSQLSDLSNAISGSKYDMLFVNAGTTNSVPSQTIAEVPTDEFVDLMVTNALSPMRVVEGLEKSVVSPTGLIGIMTSGQGSITNNTMGMREAYRGSKAALNMFMRSYAARQDARRPLALMAPGWVKTDLGGPDGRYTIEETIPKLVNVLIEKQNRPGLEYLDFEGRTVPW